MDDADVVFAARAAAARMATWLACDELDFHGAFAVASGAGESDRAIELAVEAAAIGRRLEIPDLEMLGLGLKARRWWRARTSSDRS